MIGAHLSTGGSEESMGAHFGRLTAMNWPGDDHAESFFIQWKDATDRARGIVPDNDQLIVLKQKVETTR